MVCPRLGAAQVVPALRALYTAMSTKTSDHTYLYLLLILFLILTEDPSFIERLQTTVRSRASRIAQPRANLTGQARW